MKKGVICTAIGIAVGLSIGALVFRGSGSDSGQRRQDDTGQLVEQSSDQNPRLPTTSTSENTLNANAGLNGSVDGESVVEGNTSEPIAARDHRQQRTPAPETPRRVPANIETVRPVRTDGTGSLPEGSTGLAIRYPRDADITADQDVLFAEDFEGYSDVDALSANWNEVGQSGFIDLSTEVPSGIGGERSLEMRIPVRTESLSNGIVKSLAAKQDRLFVRFYTKFDPEFDLGEHFTHTSLSISGSSIGHVSAGVVSDGRNKLFAGLATFKSRSDENARSPGRLNVNLYHPEQRYEWGDKLFPTGEVQPNSSKKFDFGSSFLSRPDLIPERGRWYCREMMFKTNTPGQHDGRVAVWQDGKLIADFTNLRVRDVASLKLDSFRFGLYANTNDQREVKKWFDNIVVATSYIGPVSTSSARQPPNNAPVVASSSVNRKAFAAGRSRDTPAASASALTEQRTPKPIVPELRAEDIPQATPTSLGVELTGFLGRHCHDCHSGNDPEGGLSLDRNEIAFGDPEVRRRWTYLFDRVSLGEMPPPDSDQPDAGSKQNFLRALGGVLTRADLDEREVVLRRLNRNEYTNTVSDLFGVYVDVSRVLLDDSTENGFDNIGSELSISSEQMQAYVTAANVVLDHVLGPEEQVETQTQTANFVNSRHVGSGERKLSDGVVLFSGGKLLPMFGMLSAPTQGLYRVKIRIRAEQSEQPVVMHVYGGNTGQIGAHTVGFFEAPPGQVRTIEFEDRAKERGDSYKFGLVGGYPQYGVPAEKQNQLQGLFIGDITVEGPIHEWTESRRRLLGSVNPERGTIGDIRSILLKIMPRAFRRPIEAAEAAPYLGLAKQAISDGFEFESALRVALTGVLCSPEFLYLEEPVAQAASLSPPQLQAENLPDSRIKAGSLSYVLATRLSYFLWSSLPDDELTSLAAGGQLVQPNVLRSQVDRMLSDPKSQRFVENFAGQWLRIRDIDFTVPDKRLYPEFNVLLRNSMVDETYAFFREILDNDLSVQNFIDSDFLMVNQPLAELYEIDGVEGLEIRRVPRPNGSVRGGVLTQASVLKVSADGSRTSPVLRGVWILNHLFGTPPSPPPSSVDIVQPNIRGAETIREQLARHRADASCARCHNQIDPPGFALESFDVQGSWRKWYRVREGGQSIKKRIHPVWEANVQYQQGPNVDATGAMPDGRPFTDIRDYKRLLLADDTAMPRALTRLLLSYSTGRELGFSDRVEVERIVAGVKTKNNGLKSLIHEVVQSETFRSP